MRARSPMPTSAKLDAPLREGFEGLWSELGDKRNRFPLETLIRLPQTLAQFVRGEKC